MDKIGLVDWLTQRDTKLAKKTEMSNTRKKLVGRKFFYSRSRIGISTTFVAKDDCKVNSSDSYSKGLIPCAPVFTSKASISKSVSSTKTSTISSLPPPVAPPFHHSKLVRPSLPHSYNVVTKNRFAALYKVDEFEEIRSTSQFQKIKSSQDKCGKKGLVKNKKPDPSMKAVPEPLVIMDTGSDTFTPNSSLLYPELSQTENEVVKNQVC